MFTPTRKAALEALEAFAPYAGPHYAQGRNFDLTPDGRPAVSLLSPYLRHRLISEEEVIRAVLAHHSAKSAGKFLQEVFWRGYWKGWLELRPHVWRDYRAEVLAGCSRLDSEAGLRDQFDAACRGETEIDCFNYWSQSLVKNGYIHNHARMWFASIWIFTLRLPWALGADFFLRHLLDGDPASNTLSWRWVAGMQTKGKTYLAAADNIATFTEGRFNPRPDSLARHAPPLESSPHPEPDALRLDDPIDPKLRSGLLLHEDDMTAPHIETGKIGIATTCLISFAQDRSPLAVSANVTEFTAEALSANAPTPSDPTLIAISVDEVLAWATENELQQVVAPYAPVGPAAEGVAKLRTALTERGIRLVEVMRPYDRMCWPHALKGFFKFKENIPDFLNKI